MKTRVLSAILTLALLLSLAPAAVIPALPASAEAKATSVGVETVVFSEDFSSNPFDRGWEESDIDGDGNGWKIRHQPLRNGRFEARIQARQVELQ